MRIARRTRETMFEIRSFEKLVKNRNDRGTRTKFVRVLTTLEISPFGTRGCVTGALVRRSPEHARCGSQRIVAIPPLRSLIRSLSHPPPRSPASPSRERERACERASEQGVAPRSDSLGYISSLSSNRGTFSF